MWVPYRKIKDGVQPLVISGNYELEDSSCDTFLSVNFLLFINYMSWSVYLHIQSCSLVGFSSLV